MAVPWKESDKLAIARQPHFIGHMVGKNKLGPQHSQWIKEVWYPNKHTSLMAHRGSYKTTSITEVGTCNALLFQPSLRIAIIRETSTAAAKTIKTIRDMIMTEILSELFKFFHGSYPQLTVDQNVSKTFSFKQSLTKEGSIDAWGIDNIPTGAHYDFILCDDTVTINDRLSRAKRVRTIENTREIMNNIIDPGKWCGFVGTPWHPEDAWEAKNEDGSLVIPAPKKYTVYQTGILTEEQIEAKRKNETSDRWAANYELRHQSPDDAIFRDPWIDRWEMNGYPVYAHVDAKYRGADTGSFTIMSKRDGGGDGQSYQADGFLFREHVDERVEWILRKCEQKRVRELHMENNKDSGYLAQKFRKAAREMDISIEVEDYHESMNKHNKIVTFLKPIFQRICWNNMELGLSDEEITMRGENLSQILGYMEGEEPDDAPDSSASLAREKFDESEGGGGMFDEF